MDVDSPNVERSSTLSLQSCMAPGGGLCFGLSHYLPLDT